MATLFITEFASIGAVQFDAAIQAPSAASGVTEQAGVTISGSSTLSAAFGTNSRFIMVSTDTDCSLAFGTQASDGTWNNPTAVATKHRMFANTTRFYVTNPGQKLAVIS